MDELHDDIPTWGEWVVLLLLLLGLVGYFGVKRLCGGMLILLGWLGKLALFWVLVIVVLAGLAAGFLLPWLWGFFSRWVDTRFSAVFEGWV